MTQRAFPDHVSHVDAYAYQLQVAGLMRALGVEIERTRVLGLRVEQAVCALAMGSDQIEESAEGLQQLDRMLQQLAALRDFLGALCRDGAVLDAPAVDAALGEVLLDDVRSRLSGKSDREDDGGQAIELFR